MSFLHRISLLRAPPRAWLTAALIACLIGMQFAGMAHRVLHSGGASAPFTQSTRDSGEHAHADAWVAHLAESACLQGDDCAAVDHLLCALALATAEFVLALIAAAHAQAARVALALFSTRPLAYHSRGPPR